MDTAGPAGICGAGQNEGPLTRAAIERLNLQGAQTTPDALSPRRREPWTAAGERQPARPQAAWEPILGAAELALIAPPPLLVQGRCSVDVQAIDRGTYVRYR